MCSILGPLGHDSCTYSPGCFQSKVSKLLVVAWVLVVANFEETKETNISGCRRILTQDHSNQDRWIMEQRLHEFISTDIVSTILGSRFIASEFIADQSIKLEAFL